MDFITDADFDDYIKSDGIVFVDFYADWCMPCKKFKPTYEKFAEDNPTISVASFDVEESSGKPAADFNVMSIPTTLVFKDGVEVERLMGSVSSPLLEEALAKASE